MIRRAPPRVQTGEHLAGWPAPPNELSEREEDERQLLYDREAIESGKVVTADMLVRRPLPTALTGLNRTPGVDSRAALGGAVEYS